MKRVLTAVAGLAAIAAAYSQTSDPGASLRTISEPILIYNNWSSYDELSDKVPQTEQLAMRELDQVLRLRRHGIRFDAYVMDAFWYAKDGGYRSWRSATWPNGPDKWLEKCRRNGIKSGLWFGTNLLVQLDAAPAWRDSLTAKGDSMCLFKGGFLPDFVNVLQLWYDRGVRVFKFDFVDFDAATPDVAASMSKDEIRRRNQNALRDALRSFREKNAGVTLIAFNGFGGDLEMTSDAYPFRSPTDLRWLTVFDSQYSGDPRPSDVPMMNFWRSQDVYSDHMVRRFFDSGLPLERIDATSAMYGVTGTVYYRKTSAWRSGLLMTLARGGWVNTIHGNLELFSDAEADWMARAVSIHFPLLALGRTKVFGGIPGEIQPYGFVSLDRDGALYSVENPQQAVNTVPLPRVASEQAPLKSGRILFHDVGFPPTLRENAVTLGPEQMAVIGFGKYSNARFDLGLENDVRIPASIRPIDAQFRETVPRTIEAALSEVPAGATLRIVMRQRTPDGYIRRTWAGGPPKGQNMGKVLVIEASQGNQALPVDINYDKVIWSGLSWAVAEVRIPRSKQPVVVRCTSHEKDPVKLEAAVYQVRYEAAAPSSGVR